MLKELSNAMRSLRLSTGLLWLRRARNGRQQLIGIRRKTEHDEPKES